VGQELKDRRRRIGRQTPAALRAPGNLLERRQVAGERALHQDLSQRVRELLALHAVVAKQIAERVGEQRRAWPATRIPRFTRRERPQDTAVRLRQRAPAGNAGTRAPSARRLPATDTSPLTLRPAQDGLASSPRSASWWEISRQNASRCTNDNGIPRSSAIAGSTAWTS